MKQKLVVVTDLGSLKAYQLEKPATGGSPRLELLEEIRLNGAHQKINDKVSDSGGRFGNGSTASGGASNGERHNAELEHRKRLVRQITEKFSALLRGDGVAACIFAASKEINPIITEGLDARLRAKIERNIAADLTKLNKAELLQRLVAAS